ncbi:type IV pilus biogenesis protein PilP [Ketobacter sp.]|uniref:type IV pilus biogenesis protein PilP n=1 Tax=Ketobacter sp. TaxID=2083498 RepID=UPI000F12C292|nr:type IV pilus biogenesis protein PilP [Ketobacter sp.]RLU00530.1 MAG: type IV pilus biogenesis protein PilP [Ketobacter sp.]
MKRLMILSMMCTSGLAYAEMDGSKILMEEAERAKEVQRLQYQAELLKQRAEIAKYMDEIQKHGGDVTDFGTVSTRSTGTSNAPVSVSAPAIPKVDELPTVLNIENNRAAFQTNEGKVFGKVGQTLPGGYRVVAISMRDGVRLQKDGMRYDIDISW